LKLKSQIVFLAVFGAGATKAVQEGLDLVEPLPVELDDSERGRRPMVLSCGVERVCQCADF
jgi:hypothetical protein